MYVELKTGGSGPAWLGRVAFSMTGLTIYYPASRSAGSRRRYLRNHRDVETGEQHWISGVRDRPGVDHVGAELRVLDWAPFGCRSRLRTKQAFE